MYNVAEAIPPLGRVHAEGAEKLFAAEFLQRSAANTFDQHGGQIVAAVGIGPCFAGPVVESLLAADDVEHVGMGVFASSAPPAADLPDFSPVPQTARMIEQLPDCD